MIDEQKNMTDKISWRKKLWFKFEDTLSKGTIAIIIWLTILTILTSIIFGVILVLSDVKPTNDTKDFNFIEAFWQSFLHTIDTGAIQGDTNWLYRVIALLITLIGVFIFSALISVLTTGLDKIFINIRKGKSEIIKSQFTLILGWSPTIFKIINELVLANANHKGRSLVILAPKDKIEMEDEILLKINQKELIKRTYINSSNKDKNSSKYYKTKILCRTGNPIDLNDLKMVHPNNARSIIILPTDDINSDINVIKCILALDSQNITEQIITEIKNPHNKNAIDFCFKDNKINNKVYIPSTNWLSKVTAQTSRQSGYSIILTELLNYETNEIYFHEAPDEIIGKSFETILASCTTSIVLGIVKKTIDENGFTDKYENIKERENVIINPLVKCKSESKNRIFESGDEIILLQFDDYKPEFSSENYAFKLSTNEFQTPVFVPEQTKILIFGWNERIYIIIDELFGYISQNSEILIIADIPNDIELLQKLHENTKIKNGNVKLQKGDTTDYTVLQKANINNYDSIIILGYDNLEIQQKDAKSILTILHIRQILQSVDKNIVAEIYDEKNRAIVELSKACDYIISENIISSMMTQLSEQPKLYWIFDELFDDKGCEIYLKPITEYISNFEIEYNFFDLIKVAASKNEIAIGYRIIKYKDEINKNYGVTINPNKISKTLYQTNDILIVLGIND